MNSTHSTRRLCCSRANWFIAEGARETILVRGGGMPVLTRRRMAQPVQTTCNDRRLSHRTHRAHPHSPLPPILFVWQIQHLGPITVDTLRSRLLEIGGRVRVSVRTRPRRPRELSRPLRPTRPGARRSNMPSRRRPPSPPDMVGAAYGNQKTRQTGPPSAEMHNHRASLAWTLVDRLNSLRV